jgi:hypothetical protein
MNAGKLRDLCAIGITQTKRFAALGLLAVGVLAGALLAQAAERVVQTSTDLPFYARIGEGEIYQDGEWAAIAFYRPPECVPEDFNLLDFMDIPAAFGCGDPEHPYLIGFGIWKNPESNVTPIQSEMRLAPGQTMPIWFVLWDQLYEATKDGVLTISELEGLDSLVAGYATFYTETLHPLGGGPQTMISIVASGLLDDGRKFSFQATGTKEENRLNHVKIEFK